MTWIRWTDRKMFMSCVCVCHQKVKKEEEKERFGRFHLEQEEEDDGEAHVAHPPSVQDQLVLGSGEGSTEDGDLGVPRRTIDKEKVREAAGPKVVEEAQHCPATSARMILRWVPASGPPQQRQGSPCDN